jgi:hypothetical protein
MLKPVSYLTERLPISYQSAARMCREILPAGVVIRIGRAVFIDPERLDEFLAQGGAALPGGWRKNGNEGSR